eukprot:scaffold26372_cov120-Isochrysis_galbana.AAC.3
MPDSPPAHFFFDFVLSFALALDRARRSYRLISEPPPPAAERAAAGFSASLNVHSSFTGSYTAPERSRDSTSVGTASPRVGLYLGSSSPSRFCQPPAWRLPSSTVTNTWAGRGAWVARRGEPCSSAVADC